MIKKRVVLALVTITSLLINIYTPMNIKASDVNIDADPNETIIDGIEYISDKLEPLDNIDNFSELSDCIEYLYSRGYDTQTDGILDKFFSLYSDFDLKNNDNISRLMLIDDFRDYAYIHYLESTQNSDGGFGLAKDYASDIIDTKLALKALEDCGETESMSKAAMYIASLQNTDGGFGYQTGLDSDPLLSAEIADILIDCANDDTILDYSLADTITALDTYLDSTAIAVDDISADNMDGVYQHFHTALFKLKKNNQYDVSPYYALQADEGGVFDDPYATAMYLELLVREQNALVAAIDAIDITNDNGYAVAAYNIDENVNISITNNFETDKAFFKAQIITPDGTSIPLDGDKTVWNTADYAEGEYTVRAEIIRSSNNETAVKSERTFNIRHRMNIDNVSLVLSQSFSRKGDDDTVAVSADIGLKNFDESKNVSVHWTVETDDTAVSDNTKLITAADIAKETIALGDFKPDTSEKRVYTIKAEIMSDDLQIAQSTTNYFVSDKSIALTYDVDKDVLYEAQDNANVTINLRDQRVVDLIFTTASENTDLLSEYSGQVESIKDKLEKLGYKVNMSNVSTSYLSAKDTFAWKEYDHIDYDDSYCADIPKHIIYEGNDIVMKGYGWAPLKDFLFVDDDKPSKKILEFDLQRDQSNDWHTLDGGGFLFNTSIENDILKGFCVLINSNGLNLYQINGINVNNFHDGRYEYLSSCSTRLKNFRVADLKAKHHIKIVADSKTLSLYNDNEQLLEEYTLPENDFGNGYGPITSYQSHCCSVRSSFTFSNIQMKTIAGEKLIDILNNYNFESDDSRYVINLSEATLDEFRSDEQYQDVAQKIKDKKINFIGLGNEDSIGQYQKIAELAAENVQSYDYSDKTVMGTVSENIINGEEAKYIKNEDSVIATDLHISGTLPDGTLLSKDIDKLCEREKLSFDVPVSLDKLTAGTDAVLIGDVTLDYTDENGVSRTKKAGDITLPVIYPAGKIISTVTTDKEEYLPYENVKISDRIKNSSSLRTAKGLKNVITVSDSNSDKIEQFTKDLPEIMTCDYTEVLQNWNTADHPAGKYTVVSEVYNGDALVASSSTEFILNVPENPVIDLSGEINIENMLFKVDDTIPVNYTVKNTGHYDLEDSTLSIKIADPSDNESVYEFTAPLDLAVGEEANGTVNVIPDDDFSSAVNNDYIVIYEVITKDGQVIPLSGDGFMLDVMDLSKLGDDVLFAMDSENASNGINMSGWKMLINGSIHSNSSITGNCSIFNVSNGCTSLLEPVFNTWQTNLGESSQITDAIELPDIMKLLRRRLLYTPITVSGGEIVEDDQNIRIYGNSSTVDADIYSEKSITIIDPENFTSDTEAGILICSEGDITIKTSNANFKGIIYAPNGTVRIESNNFNLKGRVIAKNIVFQGSVFTGETYEGDLDLFNK